ncbi:MAG: hypothetical protein ACKV2Q_12845 [Planctomycetaceae bacterium]
MLHQLARINDQFLMQLVGVRWRETEQLLAQSTPVFEQCLATGRTLELPPQLLIHPQQILGIAFDCGLQSYNIRPLGNPFFGHTLRQQPTLHNIRQQLLQRLQIGCALQFFPREINSLIDFGKQLIHHPAQRHGEQQADECKFARVGQTIHHSDCW